VTPKVSFASPETESSLSKAATIIALTCFLIIGSAAAAIFGRESIPAAGAAIVASSVTTQAVVSNRASKSDRLTVASVAPDMAEPAVTGAIPAEPLRQAVAATPPPAEIEGLKLNDPATAAPKPKLAAKPQVQKPYALLSDAQIAGIKERLKLSPSQEYY